MHDVCRFEILEASRWLEESHRRHVLLGGRMLALASFGVLVELMVVHCRRLSLRLSRRRRLSRHRYLIN
jgi:hypothetical protein